MTRTVSLTISTISLCLLILLTLATRCSNRADVFINGHIYFIDGDCYSRMTRVQMVLEHPTTIIQHHDFENYPQGITPHTTAPFDYLIAGMKKVLDIGFLLTGNKDSPWAAQTLDLAGAIVSPLLGVLTVVFLWGWSCRLRLPFRGMLLILSAVSPILVHGTLLGRPDHQSLAIFLMNVALGAEWALIQAPSRIWALIAGIAWGLGLWVTLYEPLILLTLVLVVLIIFNRHSLFSRNRADEFGLILIILAISIGIEGWRVEPPNSIILHYFQNWEKSIGELGRLMPWSPLLFRWSSLMLLVAPVLFIGRARTDRRAIPLFIFVTSVYGLTLWQMRWGYFFVLIFSMSLTYFMPFIRWRSIAWILFVLSLWPVAQEWEERLFPEGALAQRHAEDRFDKMLLREAAETLISKNSLPILAPWWWSPPLVYWSGQPAVGGSSHESLSGIVDSARFFNTDQPDVALAILRARKVMRVLIYDSDRVLETSSTLLGEPTPKNSMAQILYTHPLSAPSFLKLDYENQAFKVYSVK